MKVFKPKISNIKLVTSLPWKLWKKERIPLPFWANNDMTALGVLSALKSEGYKVPKDFSVAGFDNILMSSLPDISLTTIEHATFLKRKRGSRYHL